jgi:hypothetical protein
MSENEQNLELHLREALSHLERALEQSIQLIQTNESLKKKVGQDWEGFLGKFMGNVREKGKVSKINLLGLISFPRIR